MAFWIKNNNQVKPQIRLATSIFYYIGVLFYILWFLVRMRDRANAVVSTMQEIFKVVIFSIIVIYFLLNFIHWLKPKWFEDKNNKISQEEEMNNQSF